jgi:hypothetical protein
LQRLKLTKSKHKVLNITATLQTGTRLTNVIDLTIFNGFEPLRSQADARRVHGAPSGLRRVPEMKLDAHIYPVAQGEIGFLQAPTEIGIRCQLWAFPTNQSPDTLILDDALRQQLLAHLQTNESIRVNIGQGFGHGGVTLNMTRDRITSMLLSAGVNDHASRSAAK